MAHEPFDTTDSGGSSGSTVTSGSGSEEGEEDFPDDYEFPEDDDGGSSTDTSTDTTTETTETTDTTGPTRDDDDDDDRVRSGTTSEPGEESFPDDYTFPDDDDSGGSSIEAGTGSEPGEETFYEDSDVTDHQVATVEQAAVRRSLEQEYGGNYDIDVDQSGPGIYSYSLRSDDYYDRSGVVRLDRDQVRRQLSETEAAIEQELGIDVKPGRDFTVTETETGETRVDLTEDAIRRAAGKDLERQIETQTGQDVEPGVDFRVVETEDGSYSAEPIGEFAEQLAGTQTRRPTGSRRSPFAPPQGTSAATAATLANERIERELEAQTGVDLEPGRDFTTTTRETEDGRTITELEGFTPAGRERVTGDEYDVPLREVTIPGVGTVAVSDIPGVSEEDARVEDVIQGTAQQSRQAARGAAETLAPFSPLIFAERTGRRTRELAEQPASERPGPIEFTRSILAEPDVEGEVERQGERATTGALSLPAYVASTVGATKELGEFAAEVRTRDVGGPVLADADFEGETETVRTLSPAVGPLASGGAAPRGREQEVRFRGDEEAGALGLVAAETVETSGEVTRAIGSELSTPGGRAELTGSLIGTAVLFGGAAAVSSRAGTATRFAIQPGEEILGRGGYAATRRVAGESSAQRLFPNREPLIFSEEAAIRAARGVGAGARRAGRRVRAEAARTDVSVGVRPGVGLGGLEVEIERSEPTRITAEDIAGPPGDPRPGRVGETGVADAPEGFTRRRGRRVQQESEDVAFDRFREAREQELVSRSARRMEERLGGPGVTAPRLEVATSLTEEEQQRIQRSRERLLLDAEDAVGELEQTTAGAVSRLEVAAAGGFAGRLSPTVDSSLATRLNVLAESGTDQARRQDTRLDTRQDTRSQLRVGTEALTETRQEARARGEVRVRTEQRTGLEVETEVETETGIRVETQADAEIDIPTEPWIPPGRRRPNGRRRPPEREPPSPGSVGIDVTDTRRPGWLSETFTDIAIGPLSSLNLPQTEAYDEAPIGQRATGEFPTFAELYGSEEEQEAIAGVRSLFGAGATEDIEASEFEFTFDVGGFGFGGEEGDSLL